MTEQAAASAVVNFLEHADIPRPATLTIDEECDYITSKILTAYLKSLCVIGAVDLPDGFDIKSVGQQIRSKLCQL
ncbi:MAG: hypothetical protein GY832_03870 [Chloroflexi bacterium]|nr:hypothetical protein [Chloroflexota bacterium]